MATGIDLKNPADRDEVIQRLGATPSAKLVGHKVSKGREVWVWCDQDGQGYVSKRDAGARAFGWKLTREPGAQWPSDKAAAWMEANSIPTAGGLLFVWNGIKGKDGQLQKATYGAGPFLTLPTGTITIYARSGVIFGPDVRAAFTVENDSDGQTDYFENDRIRVLPDHPLHGFVRAALEDGIARARLRGDPYRNTKGTS